MSTEPRVALHDHASVYQDADAEVEQQLDGKPHRYTVGH